MLDKELKSKLLSNYVAWLFYLVVFYLFCSNQIRSTFSSPYLVATSVLIVYAKKGFEIFEQPFNGDAFHMQVVPIN